MDEKHALDAFAALAQETRLRIVRLLVAAGPDGLSAGAIGEAMDGASSSRMSFHLNHLEQAGLARSRRDGRSILYSATLPVLSDLIGFLMRDCCQGHPEVCNPAMAALSHRCEPTKGPVMPDTGTPGRIFNVLFLCSGNSARSILAESILAKEGAGRFRAFSAGSQPRPEVNPLALTVLGRFDYPTAGFRSKGWDEFARPGAPVMDFVFTVCDNAAGETCPVWPGQPMTAHWGIEDPAAAEGTEIQRQAAFVTAFRHLKNRITVFAALPFASLDKMSLKAELTEIGRSEGATSPHDGAA